MNRQDYVLEMLEVSKGFPGVQALDKVTLRVKKGEVHALMGENGAGKSTLMKILDGIYKPDSGTIQLRGEQVSIRNPHDAIQKGIAMIHQELNPVPAMTIAENIFLGRERHRHGFVDKKQMLRETGELLAQMGFDLDPAAPMGSLSISGCQLVEIAKAVSYHADVIIMDEPSSAITENEVAKLFQIIRNLTAEGVSIIYITHKMDEVFQIADSATVIRDGHYIDSRPIGEFTPETLVNMLVGRELKAVYPKETVPIGEVLLEACGLTRKKQYENVSFTLRRGEILGVAGLVGAGRTEVFESIAGLTRPDSGEIRMNGSRKALLPLMATEDVAAFESLTPVSTGNIQMCDCAAAWGDKFLMIGGLDPMFLIQCTETELTDYLETTIAQMGDLRHKWIIANGDSLPPNVSPDKLRLVIETAKKHKF